MAPGKWLPLLLVFGNLSFPQTLQEQVQRVLESSPAAQRTFWGVQVLDLEKGASLFELNSNHFFVPASNTKLFTTALALVRLGPDHRFYTTVVAEAPPDASGRLAGDLRLVGGGDPLLSARTVPYQKGPTVGNPLQAIEDLAAQVVSRGVRRIAGDVVGDDTAYLWAPYPEGWAQNDALWEYGAPVSALTINDNAVSLTIRPSGLILSPALEYYVIDNRLRVGPQLERRIRLERLPGARQLRLWGTLPAGSSAEAQLLLAIDDPALYAAYALSDALTRRGVAISGRPVARHRFANEVLDLTTGPAASPAASGVELARRSSPPLVELLRIIDKVSQNLHAELVLREVARLRRNIGSREAGLEELRQFLTEAAIEETSYRIEDGSGLSRLNLVTPDTVARLLAHMYRSPHRDAWLSLLPIGGEDGTLASRFDGNPEARRIRAKTGTVSHVSALAGYVESRSRGLLAFSILANNYNAPASEIRTIIDRIGIVLAQ
jgi:D-alanyl-D-alanine carboxypeptidase/D-alanyl-D-alanine-endopeptidase (penicillin-binding protein 4)